ncbi:hypothetical protein [Microbacterium sp.]|uniref:hypothetical protein n=1 Tax=Microbacterium sp. TaxID=51671 RepID=UPI00260D1677|nr:hypothetical protein [Microbacterium sp.]
MRELAALPVTFGPHEADWWMLAVTAVSVIVSGVLAWLAYRNGRRATDIAVESAKRDEAREALASQQREDEARALVAVSMLRALAVLEQLVAGDPSFRIVEAQLNERRAEALAQIDIYATDEADEELHVWFESSMAELERIARFSPTSVSESMRIASFIRQGIVQWNRRAVTADLLAVGKLG